MKAKFIRSGKYAHVNDPRSPQFYITEDEAKEGKIISGLSQLTVDTYADTGACQPLEGDEALEDSDKEVEDEESSDDVTLTSLTGKDKKKKRNRGRGSKN